MHLSDDGIVIYASSLYSGQSYVFRRPLRPRLVLTSPLWFRATPRLIYLLLRSLFPLVSYVFEGAEVSGEASLSMAFYWLFPLSPPNRNTL